MNIDLEMEDAENDYNKKQQAKGEQEASGNKPVLFKLIDEDDIQMPDQPTDQVGNQPKEVENKVQFSKIDKALTKDVESEFKEPKPSIFNSINLSFGKAAPTTASSNAFSKFSMLGKASTSSSKTPMPVLSKSVFRHPADKMENIE